MNHIFLRSIRSIAGKTPISHAINRSLYVVTKADHDDLVEAAKISDAKYKLALADMENLRFRLNKQVEDAKHFAISGFCKDLIEVTDVFEMAMKQITPESVGKSNYEGISMIEQRIYTIFKKHGLVSLNPIGEKFNPNDHQAMFETPDASKEPGSVSEVCKIVLCGDVWRGDEIKSGFSWEQRPPRGPKFECEYAHLSGVNRTCGKLSYKQIPNIELIWTVCGATVGRLDLFIGNKKRIMEAEYTETKQLRIFVGTWNVNGQPVSSTPVNLWLNCDPFPPDIYAIGFQELDLSTEAFLFSGSLREQEWLHICNASLHQKADYALVKLVRLVGMMLIIFVKKELEPHVTNIAAEVVGTGLMRKMGNKGGVAIRLDLHNTSICFINSHLAAHLELYQRRNQDYHEICSRLVFNQFQPPKYVIDHDQIYWLGDLNYRIEDMSTDEIKALVIHDSFEVLLDHDQLKRQMLARRVFEGFEEPPIRYPPTYKYDPGTNDWDSSEKSRPPAWCDRILYRGGPTQPIIYRSHPRLLLSDHKPVSCLFSSTVKIIDEVKFRKAYERLMKSLDRLENDSLPQASLNKLEFTFENVTPTAPSSDILTVSNTGQVPVNFRFVQKPKNSSYCEPWLQISPFTGLVMPGDSMNIEFRVFANTAIDCGNNNNDFSYGHSSNSVAGGEGDGGRVVGENKKKTLTDILVLHLERGKDFFITITVHVGMDEEPPLIEL